MLGVFRIRRTLHVARRSLRSHGSETLARASVSVFGIRAPLHCPLHCCCAQGTSVTKLFQKVAPMDPDCAASAAESLESRIRLGFYSWLNPIYEG